MLSKLSNWTRRHWQDLLLVGVLLGITGVATATNFTQYPMRFEDEGTYVAQARAVQNDGELTHYTYWYDHPPLGWLQMASYSTVTWAYDRYDSTIMAAREFMVVLHLVSVVLVYAIARRLRLGKIGAAAAVLLFGLSPLVIEYSRYVFLDNVAVPWLLGAFLLALSPRKHIATAMGAAACMAIAVLSKETFLIFLPALLYVLFQNSDARNRRYVFGVFGVALSAIGAFYLLFAILKGELLPGQGHVSLIDTIKWQLSGRAGSGSVFEAGTDSHKLVMSWLRTDVWLAVGSAIMLPLAFFSRRLRPFALVLLIGFVMMLRPGYLPVPYIISLLPFMALVVAGVLSVYLIKPVLHRKSTGWGSLLRHYAAGGACAAALAAAIFFVAPAWRDGTVAAAEDDADRSRRQTVAWVERNIPKNELMVVESVLWPDLEARGFKKRNLVWVFKIETDPEVARAVGGWRNIDYLILDAESRREELRKDFPTVFKAKDHAKIVATFGKQDDAIVVMKVDPRQ